MYDIFHWTCYTPEILQIQKLEFLGTNSDWTKSQFEFVPRDIKEFKFLDLVDFGDVAFSVKPAMYTTGRGDLEKKIVNIYDCQNFKQVFIESP